MEREFSGWSVKSLTSISSSDVETRRSKIGKRTPVGADNAFKLIRAIFNYAKVAYKDSKNEPIINGKFKSYSNTKGWFERYYHLTKEPICPHDRKAQHLMHA